MLSIAIYYICYIEIEPCRALLIKLYGVSYSINTGSVLSLEGAMSSHMALLSFSVSDICTCAEVKVVYMLNEAN